MRALLPTITACAALAWLAASAQPVAVAWHVAWDHSSADHRHAGDARHASKLRDAGSHHHDGSHHHGGSRHHDGSHHHDGSPHHSGTERQAGTLPETCGRLVEIHGHDHAGHAHDLVEIVAGLRGSARNLDGVAVHPVESAWPVDAAPRAAYRSMGTPATHDHPPPQVAAVRLL